MIRVPAVCRTGENIACTAEGKEFRRRNTHAIVAASPLTVKQDLQELASKVVDAGLSTNEIDDEEIMNVKGTHSGSSGRYCSRVRSLT